MIYAYARHGPRGHRIHFAELHHRKVAAGRVVSPGPVPSSTPEEGQS